jgi:hypothetical protein
MWLAERELLRRSLEKVIMGEVEDARHCDGFSRLIKSIVVDSEV